MDDSAGLSIADLLDVSIVATIDEPLVPDQGGEFGSDVSYETFRDDSALSFLFLARLPEREPIVDRNMLFDDD